MQTHTLIQGSDAWHAYRASHFNASDAPAMLGCSPYKTRSQLLHEVATGTSREVDATTQRLFDDGHRFEALARPLAENIIGEELYPVVGSNGHYSASFDGLTMDERIAFEHKSLNEDLRAAMQEGCTGTDLPKHYRVQMEQQCMVSGCERVLFMASRWNGDELIEERHCWYESDPDLRAELVAGWAQFEVDVAAYVAPEVQVEAVGRTPESLPALRIEVTGLVTASNLEQFKSHALAVFGAINRDLQTDQDFADAEKTVKWCGDVEDRLKAAKAHALAQTESIDVLFRAIDDITAEARATRLELEKLVKARKEAVREEIRQAAVTALREHYNSINTTLGMGVVLGMPAAFGADVAAAMKGKKTITSLRDAADTTLANAKIDANANADRVRRNIAILEGHKEHAFLLADAAQLAVSKDHETLGLIVKQRIADHQAAEAKRLEAERERIAAEERAKAEAKVRAEQAAREKAEREATAAAQRQQAMLEAAQRRREFESTEKKEEQPTPANVQTLPARQTRPTDAQIIEVLALHFRVHESKVLEWILDMDLDTAGQKLAASF
ncbi:MAG TPA: YqaJ viral recombinase family protein [Noviherbaspirillum sp.]|nr:YqaJ viral recombinase family protein [Noviherbaspirillum sp.]